MKRSTLIGVMILKRFGLLRTVWRATANAGSLGAGGKGNGGRKTVAEADGVTNDVAAFHTMLRKYRGRLIGLSGVATRAALATVAGVTAGLTHMLVEAPVTVFFTLLEALTEFGGGRRSGEPGRFAGATRSGLGAVTGVGLRTVGMHVGAIEIGELREVVVTEGVTAPDPGSNRPVVVKYGVVVTFAGALEQLEDVGAVFLDFAVSTRECKFDGACPDREGLRPVQLVGDATCDFE